MAIMTYKRRAGSKRGVATQIQKKFFTIHGVYLPGMLQVRTAKLFVLWNGVRVFKLFFGMASDASVVAAEPKMHRFLSVFLRLCRKRTAGITA